MTTKSAAPKIPKLLNLPVELAERITNLAWNERKNFTQIVIELLTQALQTRDARETREEKT